MRPHGVEYAAHLLDDSGQAVQRDGGHIQVILARLKAGLGPCERCRRVTATTLLPGRKMGETFCASCAVSIEQSDRDRRFPYATADADRARRLRLAELQTDTLNQRVRRTDAAGTSSLCGYAIRFDDTFRRPDGFDESVCRGAFADAIARGGLVLCVDHDRSRIVARQDDGTLRLREHGVGLWLEADVSGSVAGRTLLAMAGATLFGASFAFREATSRVELTQPPRRGRLLRRLDVTELSLVTRARTAAYTRAWLARDTAQARDRARCERLEDAVASC